MRQPYTSPVRTNIENKIWRASVEFILVRDVEQLAAILVGYDGGVFAVDLETTGLDFDVDEIVGFSLCGAPDASGKYKAYYVPVGHRWGNNLPLQAALDLLFAALYSGKAELGSAETRLVYNYLYDARMLSKYGLDLDRVKFFDVMGLVWNTDCNVPMPSLKESVHRFLGIRAPTYEDVVGEADNFQNLEPEAVYEYAAADAYFTYLLARVLYKFYENNRGIVDLDNDFLRPMLEYMGTPIPIDKQLVESDYGEIEQELQELEKRIHVSVGKPFDVGSSLQLGRVLNELGIDTGARTETTQRMAVGVDELAKVKNQHECIPMMIEHALLRKKLTSFVEPFLEHYRDDIGGVRFQYQVFSVPTGRLASGVGKKKIPYWAKINIQAVELPEPMMYDGEPSDDPDAILGWKFTPHPQVKDANGKVIDPGGDYESTDPHWNVRNYIKPVDGHYVVSIDYSAQELVIIANLSGDPAFVDPLLRGEDIHKDTGIKMWGKENYNKERRVDAKGATFGLCYGGTPWTLKTRTMPEKSMEECSDIFVRWWDVHGGRVYWKTDDEGRARVGYVSRVEPTRPDGLCAWHHREQAAAKKNGFFKTLMGRIRRVDFWYNSPDKWVQAFADRTVENGPVQGGCGDILRYVIPKIYWNITRPYGDKTRFMATVHDEVDFSVTKDEKWFTEIVLKFKKHLTDLDHLHFKVPLNVNVSVGNRWGNLFAFTYDGVNWVPKKRG